MTPRNDTPQSLATRNVGRRGGAARRLGAARATAYLLLCSMLGGCSYFETMLNRPPRPDSRIQLSPNDSPRFLSRREIRGYTCATELLLVCDGVGPRLTCRCIGN